MEIPSPEDFMNRMTSLYEDEESHDIQIAVGGETLSAHKAVLSSGSDYFKELFQNYQTAFRVQFAQFDVKEVSDVIEFIYKGRVPIQLSRYNEFTQCADFFKVSYSQANVEATKPADENQNFIKVVKTEDGHGTCLQCDRNFSTVSYAKRHFKEVHLKDKVLSCQFCPKRFTDKFKFQRHCRSRHPSGSGLIMPDLNSYVKSMQ